MHGHDLFDKYETFKLEKGVSHIICEWEMLVIKDQTHLTEPIVTH